MYRTVCLAYFSNACPSWHSPPMLQRMTGRLQFSVRAASCIFTRIRFFSMVSKFLDVFEHVYERGQVIQTFATCLLRFLMIWWSFQFFFCIFYFFFQTGARSARARKRTRARETPSSSVPRKTSRKIETYAQHRAPETNYEPAAKQYVEQLQCSPYTEEHTPA